MNRFLLVLCLLAAPILADRVYGAPQPLNMNYICASGGVGGWQNSSDTDVGRVAIHTTLLGNVADGRYYVHLSGVNMYWERDFLVEVTGGVVSFNQDAVVFAETRRTRRRRMPMGAPCRPAISLR